MATPIVEYNVSTAAIAILKDKYALLKADTPEGYQHVKEALREVVSYRTDVENQRKLLKADALEFGRKVDAEAKRITALILEVEEPLKAEKKKVDDEKDRIAREKAEAERKELERLRAEEQARKDAAEQAERERIRKEQEAENARLAAEREQLAKERAEQEKAARVERERLDAERREQEAKLAAERKAMDEQQAKIREEQQRIEVARIERGAKERAEREARERAERDKAEAEAAAKAAEELRKLRASQVPDKEKLAAYAEALNAVEEPTMGTRWGQAVLDAAVDDLDTIAHSLLTADPTKELARA